MTTERFICHTEDEVEDALKELYLLSMEFDIPVRISGSKTIDNGHGMILCGTFNPHEEFYAQLITKFEYGDAIFAASEHLENLLLDQGKIVNHYSWLPVTHILTFQYIKNDWEYGIRASDTEAIRIFLASDATAIREPKIGEAKYVMPNS